MTFASHATVTGIVESLLALQNIKLHHRRLPAEQDTECERLRANVPAGILEKFDRALSRGRKAVAIVDRGVCSVCHLRLPSGTMAALAYTTKIHVCDNCGRFLYLPEDESLDLSNSAPRPPKPAKTPVKRSSTKTVALVV
jgi:predicted  nucleic acid-binding Zn-ribbon protein